MNYFQRLFLLILSFFHRIFSAAEKSKCKRLERKLVSAKIVEQNGNKRTLEQSSLSAKWLSLGKIINELEFCDSDDFLKITFIENDILRVNVYAKIPESLVQREIFYNIPTESKFPNEDYDILPREIMTGENKLIVLDQYMCNDNDYSIHGDTFRCKHISSKSFSVILEDGSEKNLDPDDEILVEFTS
jgi:hypothetical protein